MKHELEGVRDVGTSNTSCCLRRAVSRFDRCVNILSVGLQDSSASGLPALGQLVRPRREVPSLDRGFAVTSAMPFLKPDVQGCGYSELSGMQYLSISRVVRGHHLGRESALYLEAPNSSVSGHAGAMFCHPRDSLTAKRTDKLCGQSLRGSVQGCAFVGVFLLVGRCKLH